MVVVENSWSLFGDKLLPPFSEYLKSFLKFSIIIPMPFLFLMQDAFQDTRYIKVKVEHYLLFMFSPPKISQTVRGIKYNGSHLFTVFYLIQPSSKQIICFDIQKQNSMLPIVFYVPCQDRYRLFSAFSPKKIQKQKLQGKMNKLIVSYRMNSK